MLGLGDGLVIGFGVGLVDGSSVSIGSVSSFGTVVSAGGVPLPGVGAPAFSDGFGLAGDVGFVDSSGDFGSVCCGVATDG